jgi:hypothetical protein
LKRVYNIDLSTAGINELKGGLKEFDRWVERKSSELASRLAEMGATKAEVNFSAAYYDGNYDVSVSVEERGKNSYAVVASGATVLFVEFGSGLIGYGHPEPHGYGPGTYPSDKGHWSDPNGWWYAHGRRSHGNPPSAAMYNAVKELEMELAQVVREVFAF